MFHLDPRSKVFFVALTIVATLGVITVYGWQVGLLISLRMWVPILAFALISLVGWFVWQAKRRAYEPWAGRYYAFEGRHLRCCEDASGVLWFVDRDICAAIEGKPDGRVLRHFSVSEYRPIARTRFIGLSQAGIRRLLLQSRHANAERLLRYFEREVFRSDKFALIGQNKRTT